MARKNYQSIVKPLKKIEEKLTAYAADQTNTVENLLEQKERIDVSIGESKQERKMAKFTAWKISELIGGPGQMMEDGEDTPTPATDEHSESD